MSSRVPGVESGSNERSAVSCTGIPPGTIRSSPASATGCTFISSFERMSKPMFGSVVQTCSIDAKTETIEPLMVTMSRRFLSAGQRGCGPGMPGAWNAAVMAAASWARVWPAAVGMVISHAPTGVSSVIVTVPPPAAPPGGVSIAIFSTCV
jgi:hypothetical protein